MDGGVAALAVVPAINLLDQLKAALLADQFKQGVQLGFGAVVIFLRGGRTDIEEVGQTNDLPE